MPERRDRAHSAGGRAAVLAVGAGLLLGLLLAPAVYHNYDVVDCFLTWARASQGLRPALIYLTDFKTDCDYPPVVPYLLTAVEAARRALEAREVGPVSLILVKLPNLLAWPGLVVLALLGLRAPLGPEAAPRAALLIAAGPAFFVNAAAWGQFDVLLSFFVVAAVVALLNGRPGWAGAALGAGLATKLLAVVAVPVLLVWTLRKLGARAVLIMLAGTAAAMALLAAPLVVAGAGERVLLAYTGAVDYYPFRTAEAYNAWYLLDRFDVFVRGLPASEARLDSRAALGPVTFRHLGLAALVVYVAFVASAVWRWPSARGLVLGAAMSYFGFFMLPTQVHQRYLVPAVALLALAAWGSRRLWVLFVLLTLTATLNQALDLARAVLDHALAVAAADLPVALHPSEYRPPLRAAASAVAVVNVVVFVWAVFHLRREMAQA